MKKPGSETWEACLRLLPLLLLYGLFVCLKSKAGFQWDEERYFLNARNLLKGYLASPETLLFWNGPGYPLYLVPFVALKLPLLLAKLGNAFFLYLSVVYFHAGLGLLGVAKRRTLYAYALGLFLLAHGSLIELLMTESLSACLVAGAAYHFLHASLRADRARRHVAGAGFLLGYLALTKVFFGYALTAGLFLALGAWAWGRARKRWAARQPAQRTSRWGSGPLLGPSRGVPAASSHPTTTAIPNSAKSPKSAAALAATACGLGLILCVPYLAHTYAKTGQLFFWSNSGGSQLYCMTLEEKELLGDWLNFEEVIYFPGFFPIQAPFYRRLNDMDYLSRDRAFKQAALRNIRHHPRKVFQNWRANVNRMVFGFPVSRYPGSDPDLSTGNRSFIYALPFFLCVCLAWPTWLRRASLPAPLWACGAFAAIALGGLSLLSAIPRMVFPLLPVVALWLATVRERTMNDAEA